MEVVQPGEHRPGEPETVGVAAVEAAPGPAGAHLAERLVELQLAELEPPQQPRLSDGYMAALLFRHKLQVLSDGYMAALLF